MLLELRPIIQTLKHIHIHCTHQPMAPVFTCHAISGRLVSLVALTALTLLSHAIAARLLFSNPDINDSTVQQGPGA